MELRAADEMVPPRPEGRTFGLPMRPRLADCSPTGRMRLDAIARWLQDVAHADVEDAGVADHAVWVLRRTRIRVEHFPRFGERCWVQTFCSGIGRMWAERRTTITTLDPELDVPATGPIGWGSADGSATDGDVGGQRAVNGERTLVETAALWIHLDPARRVPSPVTQGELDIFGSAIGGRAVGHRLTHPRPEHLESDTPWRFREIDCDLADHVNNAAYWGPLEEELLTRERSEQAELTEVEAEIEFRVPAQPGPKRVLTSGPMRWLTDPAGSQDPAELYASTVLTNARTTVGSN